MKPARIEVAPAPPGAKRKAREALILAFAAAIGWLLSGAVHELGHAIAAKAVGLRVLHIQPWAFLGRAHVRVSGDTGSFGYAAFHISGMLFTVLVGIAGLVAIALAGRKWRGGATAAWLFIPMMAQSLAWVGHRILTEPPAVERLL